MNTKGISRRALGALAFGPAGSAFLTRAAAVVHQVAPGIKLCVQSSPKPSDEQLLFLKQLGAEYVSVGSTPELQTAEGFLEIKKRYADAGIAVWNIGNSSVHNMPEVTLNLPGRDQKIEEYKQYLRNLGKAGICYTTYAHMGNGIWTSSRNANVRGSRAREFDQNSPDAKDIGDQSSLRDRFPTAASLRRKRSGRTTRTSSSKPLPSRSGKACGSVFIPTIRPSPCSPVCRAVSSVILKGTKRRWRSPTVRTLESVSA